MSQPKLLEYFYKQIMVQERVYFSTKIVLLKGNIFNTYMVTKRILFTKMVAVTLEGYFGAHIIPSEAKLFPSCQTSIP